MPKKSQKNSKGGPSLKLIYSFFVAGLVVLIIGGGWLWYKDVYQDPENVFWGMIDNNLSTSSVTRHIVQTPEQTGGSHVDQLTRLQFGAQNAVQSIVTITQGEGDTKSVVKSETIGDQDNDYSRYMSIETNQKKANGEPLDFSGIVGIWGKTEDGVPGNLSEVTYFRQAYLGSVVAFAQLPSASRSEIVRNFQEAGVYEVDFAGVAAQEKDGQSVVAYKVKVNPKKYVAELIRVLGFTGLKAEGLDPEIYSDSRPIEATFYVNPRSKQLVNITYSGMQEENYSSYGLTLPIEVPAQTIPFSELQQKIQEVQS